MNALLKAVPPARRAAAGGRRRSTSLGGPRQVLADLIASAAVPVVRLTEIFRQAAASRIIVNAHRINDGQMPEWEAQPGSDFYFIASDEPEEVVGRS